MKQKLGLVLAGGGGKGAYHIGVWKALKEYGMDANITAVAGTSVGALNSVLFLQGNYEVAEDIWRSITQDKILTIDSNRVISKYFGKLGYLSKKVDTFTKNGVFSRDGLLNIIEKNVNLSLIANSDKLCYAACCEVPSLNIEYFKLNNCSDEKIKSIVLASSALPFVFDFEEIDGRKYADGGLKDNIPIQPLYDEGCRNFIVVHLGRDQIIDKSKFNGATIIEIVPQEYQGGLLSGTLDFTPEGARRRIEQGYNDTIKILKPIYEMGIVQVKISETLNFMKQNESCFSNTRCEVLEKRNKLKEEIKELLGNQEEKNGVITKVERYR